ncbi:MAG: hypothetical protein FJ291_07235 [Planctomycetes bacterium]|nr:hypothetical protein [Planctomycetota bacterium]
MTIRQIVPIALSLILPGAGHIAAGKAARGILIFFLFGFAVDGWVYSQAASVLPPERVAVGLATVRAGSLALGGLLWAFAVFDTTAMALRRRRIAAKAEAADALVRNALVAFLRDDFQAALKDLHAAQRINDQDPDVFFHLGVIYQRLGQPRKARKALHQCIRYDQEGKWDTQAQDQLQGLSAAAPAPAARPAGAEGSASETRATKADEPREEAKP